MVSLKTANWNADLAPLLEASSSLGTDRSLVQGAGGNFSVKNSGTIWIKASGARLAEALAKSIYLPLDIELGRVLALESADLSSARLEHAPTQQLRASIETALHLLLPHRYVFHVHSVPSIAAGLTPAGCAAFERSMVGLTNRVVPYAMPGLALARAVHSAAGDTPSSEPLVLLLQNHGLVVGGDSIEEVTAIITLIEDSLRLTAPPVSVVEPVAAVLAGSLLYSPDTLDASVAAHLTGWGLTPDSTVFLGPKPFALVGEDPSNSSCLIRPDGSVEALRDLGVDEVEIAVSLVDVAMQVRGEVAPARLSPDDINALVNWDAEIWRRGMKR